MTYLRARKVLIRLPLFLILILPVLALVIGASTGAANAGAALALFTLPVALGIAASFLYVGVLTAFVWSLVTVLNGEK